MSFLNPNHISSLSHPDNEDPFLSLFCFYNTPSRALSTVVAVAALRDPSTILYPSTLASRQSYLNPATSKPLTPFQWKVYDLVLKLPPGRTTTYGSLAAHLHTSPRAVGTALSRNPFCPKVPCHRVAAKDGGMGGFLGEKSTGLLVDQKIQLLRQEGVTLTEGKVAGSWVVQRDDASGLGEWIWA